jgi:tetratricopeptide (TPR) repeat protein
MSAMRTPAAAFLTVSIAVCAALPAGATCGGGGGGGRGGMAPGGEVAEKVYQVPWKTSGPKDAPSLGLTLYWFPASMEELKLSSLRTSRDLSLYSAQCVAMEVADASTAIGAKLEATGKAPIAVLVDASGAVLGRVPGEGGKLKAAPVEKLVHDELRKREDAVAARLEDARTKTKSGDNAAAIDVFKSVWDERCLFPKKAKDAAKELKKLGTVVDDKAADAAPFEPVFDGPTAAAVVDTMTRGLAAEMAGRYKDAASLYAAARRLDPDDPTPQRYLGELYRHHTGEWKKARQVFETLLAHRADPLSRAVALHGLGKMTIHEGRFARGRELFEQSVAVMPLPLTYRNLAVYWNSEGDAVKTAEYVSKAMALDPDDAYNRVFAAVFYAASGRAEEALQIAKDNEALLPASYNLAAIYAQAGQRDRALAMLRRHFYQYERFHAVRSEEMMEARVDAVFASLRKDAEFLTLTSLADGMLSMPMTAH